MDHVANGESFSGTERGAAPPTRGWVTLTAARVARSRLVQFLFGGAVLFAIAPPAADPRRVDVTGAELDAAVLRESSRRGGRVLEPEEVARVRSHAVEDAVLAREARRLGLDQGDGIVRQRLVQKQLFLAEDLGGASRPVTEDDLRAFYDARTDLYRAPLRATFVHVFGRDEAMLRALVDDVTAFERDHPGEIPPLGDPFPQRRRVSAQLGQLAPSWGDAFPDAVAALPVDVWSGPIASSYGFHLVKVIARQEPGREPYAQARARVKLDVLVDRREQAVERHVGELLRRYDVRVDGEPMRDHVPSARTASHVTPSVED